MQSVDLLGAPPFSNASNSGITAIMNVLRSEAPAASDDTCNIGAADLGGLKGDDVLHIPANSFPPDVGANTARLSGNCASRALMIEASERTIALKTPINRVVTRAEDAAVQVGSIRPAFSQHPFRSPQHLQLSTTSRPSVVRQLAACG